MQRRSLAAVIATAAAILVFSAGTAVADTEVFVTAEDPSGWYFSSDHQGEDGVVTPTTGTGGFAAAPAGSGYGDSSYELVIESGQKARLMTDAYDGLELSSLDGVTYSTNKSGMVGYAPSINVVIDPAGPDDFVTLVWEANKAGHAIQESTWQAWDTTDGDGWWTPSIQPFSSSTPGSNANPTDLATLTDFYGPGATIVDFAVNVGRHGAMAAYVDGVGVTIDGETTTYDFGIVVVPTSKNECKKGGWESFENPTFRNQGDCVSFVATGGKNGAAPGDLAGAL